jgi:DNA repair protein RadC
MSRCSNAERPRERLFTNGIGALTDAELLAVVLRSGVAGCSALDAAHGLIDRFQTLTGVFAAPIGALMACRGLGPGKAAQLKASVELMRRALIAEARRASVLTSPEAVRDYLRLSLAARPHEAFVVLFLDSQHRLLAADELFRGTLAQTSVYPREIVKAALAHNAAAVIFAHNHPSGVAEPSRADELLTQSLKQALALVDIHTLDHFVIAGTRVVSFAERGAACFDRHRGLNAGTARG